MRMALSVFLCLALAVSLFAGSAFAAAGDTSGAFTDFPFVCVTNNLAVLSPPDDFVHTYFQRFMSNWFGSFVLLLPYSLASVGSIDYSTLILDLDDTAGALVGATISTIALTFFDVDGNELTPASSGSVPVGTRYIVVGVTLTYSSSSNNRYVAAFTGGSYSDFVYDTSSSSDIDLSTIESLLSFSDQTYTSYTGPYSWTNHVFAGTNTDSSFGDAFQRLLYVGSGTAILMAQLMTGNPGSAYTVGGVTYNNLPDYLNAVAARIDLDYAAALNTQALQTSRFNSVDSDLDVLQSNMVAVLAAVGDLRSGVSTALYADYPDDTDANKIPWSVAQWLRGIYDSVSSFFASFWSPAETDLKTAAEDGMQAAADNGNVASAAQVDDLNSAGDAFKSFGSTGNVDSDDVMDVFSDSASYEFFSQTTKDNLTYHPPVSGQRSASLQSDPDDEFVDELGDKLSDWREVLGLA